MSGDEVPRSEGLEKRCPRGRDDVGVRTVVIGDDSVSALSNSTPVSSKPEYDAVFVDIEGEGSAQWEEGLEYGGRGRESADGRLWLETGKFWHPNIVHGDGAGWWDRDVSCAE